MAEEPKKPTSFNIITSRGDPEHATTLSGHHVEKLERVVIPSPFASGNFITLKCADYHMEHFVYIDPMFDKTLPESETKSYWFAMCTCGSPAVIISGVEAARHEGVAPNPAIEWMLVCQFYQTSLIQGGHGYHLNQDKRKWS